MLKPDHESAIIWARRAIEVAEQTDTRAALVHAYNNLGSSLLGVGDPTGFEWLQRSLGLAIESNLVDDASRAYANMAGDRVMRLPYPESEAFLEEAIAFAERNAPDGWFWRYHRAVQADFWIISGRWDEAHARLEDLSAVVRPIPYHNVQVSQARSKLASHRGGHDTAAAIARPVMVIAMQVGDFQAIGPMTMALAHAEAGLGAADRAAIAVHETVRRAVDAGDPSDVAWALFEAADVLTTVMAYESDVAARAVVGLRHLAAAAADVLSIGGTPAEVAGRRALLSASLAQLASLSRRLGSPAPAIRDGALPLERAGAAEQLETAHRPFDVARVRLWLAEDTDDLIQAATAAAVFDRLRAAPFARRARAVATR